MPPTLDELRAERESRAARVASIDAEFAGERFPEEIRSEWNTLNEEIDDFDDRINELETRAARVERVASRENSRDEPTVIRRTEDRRHSDIYDLSTVRRSFDDPTVEGQELRDRALRAVEGMRPRNPHITREQAQNNVAALLETDSEDGRFARYILAVGSPTYRRAFGKALQGALLSREEHLAIEQASRAQRALSLAGGSGGFAVPFELDPSILNTSNGVVNPIRQLARVIPVTVDEWRGVSSTGITATYEAEATETTDNAPTLVQPTISTEKAQAFVPFSIEIGQDWNSLQSEMAELLEDAKDTLEAAKFVSGTGTNEPFGVITGTTNTINAAAGQTFTLANLYSLIAGLPPRYRARAAFIGDLQILNRIRQFDTVGSSAAIWVDSLQDDVAPRLLGKPVYEASEMADTPATGNKFLLFGDFSRYVIIDRIGLSVEVIPHLMGANRRPTGQRGLYAYWRNGAKVVDANAFRALIGVV